MTNTEAGTEFDLYPDPSAAGVQVLQPRLVPLGGPRAMTVRRTLPHRDRSFVGAWCFVDHYGPDDVARTGGMNVPPHPHTGLQTVTWLFDGRIEHRDSAGVAAIVAPGEVNLMTGGYGIAHSEVSTAATSTLRGVQLWVVLPSQHRQAARDFQHHRAPLVELAPGVQARVFIGRLAGHESPVHTFTELLGAELHLAAGVSVTLPVPRTHEHALLVDRGTVSLSGTELADGELGIVDAGPTSLTVGSQRSSRAVLLGGVPFGEDIVMWWNFIGASHEEIERARQDWQQHSDRFGEVAGYDPVDTRLDAPPMPGLRLRPRGRRGRSPRG